MGRFNYAVIDDYYILDTAGHNCRKTKSLRIIHQGRVVKRIRYKNTDLGQAEAVCKAKDWVNDQITENSKAPSFGCAI